MLSVPKYVVNFCELLSEVGQCYLIGGAVRDLLLGKRPSDYDFLFIGKLSLLTRRVKRFYVPSNNSDKTIVAIKGKREFEINIEESSLVYNLSKRDFTINSIAYDIFEDKIIDPNNGVADIKKQLIRGTGDVLERFNEDPLRILRGIRLSVQLNFEIEKETAKYMRWNAFKIVEVPPYRLLREFEKILSLGQPSSVFKKLEELKILYYFFPELASCVNVTQNKYHKYDVFNHILKVIDFVPKSRIDTRFAALLHDIGKPATKEWDGEKKDYTFYRHEILSAEMAEIFLKKIGMPHKRRDKILKLIRNHMFFYEKKWSDKAVRKFIGRVGAENIDDLFYLRKADRIGTGKKKGFEDLLELQNRIREELDKNNIFTVGDLDISGYDLIELGFKGPLIGKIKRFLLEKVMEDPEINKKEILLEIVKNKFLS